MPTTGTADYPSAIWRANSFMTILGVSSLSRLFMFAFSKPEVNGLDGFIDLLLSRKDVTKRRRGLLTGNAMAVDPSQSIG